MAHSVYARADSRRVQLLTASVFFGLHLRRHNRACGPTAIELEFSSLSMHIANSNAIS